MGGSQGDFQVSNMTATYNGYIDSQTKKDQDLGKDKQGDILL